MPTAQSSLSADPKSANVAPPSVEMTPEEREAAGQVLTAEYGLLAAALGAAWSASLTRTSLFLFSLSAAGVALGLVAGADPASFRYFALVVLPLLLFLGAATFVRLVQVQRESIVYITGLNRIRGFFRETVPAVRPYLVLPVHDDEVALYRSPGTGMARHRPRNRILYLVVQTQGVVGVVTAAVAAAWVGLAAAPAGSVIPWLAAAAFVITFAALLAHWRRSLAELRAAIKPVYPTPAEEIGQPF